LDQTLKRPYFLVNLFCLLAVSILFRLLYLDTIPGLSGDEAVSAVKLHQWLKGLDVSWRVPTGRSISPLYVAFILPFEALFKPSFWLLRLPGAVSGVALIGLTYFLTRRVFNAYVALVATILVATFPININYSRITIEQSLMGPIIMVLIYYCQRRQWVRTGLAYVAALLLHPVNIFITPLVGASIFGYLFYESQMTQRKKWVLSGCVLVSALVVATWMSLTVPPGYFSVSAILSRLVDIKKFFLFIFYFVGTLSGVTVIEDFAGPLPFLIKKLLNGFIWILFFGGFGFGLRSLRQQKDRRALAFVLGWVITLVAFAVVAGSHGVSPGLQRYSVFLTVPSAITLALLWNALVCMDKWRFQMFGPSLWLVSLIGWGFLVIFGNYYLLEFKESGGRSHRFYKTASQEPKQAAYSWIIKNSAEKNSQIVAEDWWIYHPFGYLSRHEPRIKLFRLRKEIKTKRQLRRVMEQGGYAVGWNGRALERTLRRLFPKDRLSEETFSTPSGEPLLKIWRLKEVG